MGLSSIDERGDVVMTYKLVIISGIVVVAMIATACTDGRAEKVEDLIYDVEMLENRVDELESTIVEIFDTIDDVLKEPVPNEDKTEEKEDVRIPMIISRR